MLFTQCEDLTKIKTSLEIPSQSIVAQLEFNGLKVIIDVIGYVKVRFFEDDGEGGMKWNTYYNVSDFPDELIALIRADGHSERYEFENTNWFSLVFYDEDGCIVEEEVLNDNEIIGKSPEQVYESLVECANWLEEMLDVEPTNFKGFSDLKPNEFKRTF